MALVKYFMKELKKMDKEVFFKYFKLKREIEELCAKYVSKTFYPDSNTKVIIQDVSNENSGMVHISANISKDGKEPYQQYFVISTEALSEF